MIFEEQKSGMTHDKIFMAQNPTNDELQDARERARLAMEGETRKTKQAEEEKSNEEKRKIARLAMEGSERRLRREAREKDTTDKETMRKRIDEEVKRRVTEAAQKKATEENERRNLQLAKEQELKQKENQFTQSQNVIEQLKKEKGSSLHPLRTLQSDLAGAVQTENLSATKIAIAEQKNPRPIQITEQTSSGIWKKITSLFIILIFILITGAGGYWYWINRDKTSGTTSIAVQQSIIYAENSREINTTETSSTELIKIISELLNSPSATGETINNIYFTKETSSADGQINKKVILSFPEWQKYSQSLIPEDFSRFVNDYMIGLHRGPEENSIFITLKIDLFDNVFQELLDHEGDYVQNIFKNLDGKEVVGTSTKYIFTDRLVKNINTRTLADDQGKIIMLYSFLDRNTLVIAQTENALYRAYTAYNTPRPKN